MQKSFDVVIEVMGGRVQTVYAQDEVRNVLLIDWHGTADEPGEPDVNACDIHSINWDMPADTAEEYNKALSMLRMEDPFDDGS